MHHKRRYDNTFKVTAYFYGENISDREKETAQKLLKAMAVNFHSSINKIIFLNNPVNFQPHPLVTSKPPNTINKN
jgi:hypothetical protein